MVSDCSPLLDTLGSVFAFALLAFAGGMYPIGLMLGAPCSPCCAGGLCISFKSVGWAGMIVDLNTSGESAQSGIRHSGIINGDGYGRMIRIVGGSSSFLTEFSLPLSLRSVSSACDLQIDVTESLVRATLSIKVIPYVGSIVLESDQVEAFVSGEVVHVSQVVSNTVPNTVDEYNNPMVAVVGSFYVKRDFISGCKCECHSNFYDTSQPLTTPDTYTLQFTNTADRPYGPRWPSPSVYGFSTNDRGGKYAAFLPIGDLTYSTTVGIFTNTYEVAGCNAYMPRFQSPIVLRKVLGTLYSYISDPIQVRPCVQVRYSLLLCGSPIVSGSGYQDSSPRLLCTTIPQNAHVGPTDGSYIFTPAPMCVWEAQAYQENPSAYADYRNSFVYVFGNFATVSPGGSYSPETQLLCGQSLAANISLAAGCYGSKCPQEEIELVIAGSDSIFSCDGTYSLPLTGSSCVATAAAVGVNFLSAGVASYRALFSINGWLFDFRVLLSARLYIAGPPEFAEAGPGTSPGCDLVTAYFFCSAAFPSGFASTNAYVIPRRANGAADGSDAGRYRPVCAGDSLIESYWENITMQANFGGGPSQFPKLGNVSVTF